MTLINDIKKIVEIARMSKRAFWQYKWQIAVLTSLGFISGVLGGIGINAIIPLFSFIAGGEKGGDDIISQYIERLFLFFHIDFNLKYLLLFVVLLFVLKAVIMILFSYINVRIASGYEEKTRTKLFQATIQASWPYLLKQKLGYLEKVLMVNIQQCRELFSQISVYIMTLTSLMVYTVVAVNISPLITFITFVLGASLFFVFKPLMRKIRHISYETEKINRDVAHHINENILGMKTVKVMSVDSKILSIGKDFFKKIRSISIRSYILSIFTSALIEPLSIIFIAVVFTIAYKTSDFSLASLLAIIYLIKQIFLYITRLQEDLVGMNSSLPYLKSVLEYEEQAMLHKEKDEGSLDFKFNDSLEFKNVDFSYSEDKEVLSNVNFKIKKGEVVGLIGPSGTGKTTIVDLVLRLFHPTKGEILLDKKNISDINLNKWRDNIGYVSQDIFLKNDTIRNNIKFYDDNITNNDIEEAARKANIYDFIKDLPEGFDTNIGERGVMLSGGQRQRIIIARILARKPKLLILDEATSALDNISERKIKKVIENLKGEITVFVIAHRLSTVLSSDKLIVLEKGRVIEEGSPKDLLKDKESYFTKAYHLR